MNEIEELGVYRQILEITGDMLFVYNIGTDTIEYLSGRNGMSQGGYVINGYLSMLNRQYVSGDNASMMEGYLQNLQNGEINYFECDVNLRNYTNEQHLYHVIGKKEYENGIAVRVIGKMVPENEVAATKSFESVKETENFRMGILKASDFRNRFADKCAELSGKTGAYLCLYVNNLDVLCKDNRTLFDGTIINIEQTLKRNFEYDVLLGRTATAEFSVVYYGYKLADFFEKLDVIKSELESISVGEETVKIDGGVYYGTFDEGSSYEMIEKSHIALTSAKYNSDNVIVMYSKNLEKSLRDKEYRENSEIDNLHFEHLLTEKILDIIMDNGKSRNVLSEIFSDISKRYGIDRITIFMDNVAEDSYYWLSVEDIITPFVLSDNKRNIFNEYYEKYGKDGVFVINETAKLKGLGVFAGELGSRSLKAFAGCCYESIEGTLSVCFENFEISHRWNEAEIRTLRFITRIVSAFINRDDIDDTSNTEELSGTRDGLTGLLQYENFLSEADKYIKEHPEEKLVVAYMGIHNFVSVNSKHSFKKGDEVLKTYAELMSNAEKRYIMGSRISADNFVMLATEYDSHGNSILDMSVNGFCNTFEQLYNQELGDCELAVYTGIKKVGDGGLPLEEYVKLAHKARSMALDSGSKFHFSDWD